MTADTNQEALMRRGFLLSCVVVQLLSALPSAWAGQVTLTLPDDQLRAAVEQVAAWNHCQGTDEEKTRCVADQLVRVVSLNHYQGLAFLQGEISIFYDTQLRP